jgi:hypothetical protein
MCRSRRAYKSSAGTVAIIAAWSIARGMPWKNQISIQVHKGGASAVWMRNREG